MVLIVKLGQQYNVGEKPTVILSVHCHAGTTIFIFNKNKYIPQPKPKTMYACVCVFSTIITEWIVVVCCFVVFLTLTDPLRIQPWSQDRRNQTKSNRESEISRESRQKRTDKKVASKVYCRDKIEWIVIMLRRSRRVLIFL